MGNRRRREKKKRTIVAERLAPMRDSSVGAAQANRETPVTIEISFCANRRRRRDTNARGSCGVGSRALETRTRFGRITYAWLSWKSVSTQKTEKVSTNMKEEDVMKKKLFHRERKNIEEGRRQSDRS